MNQYLTVVSCCFNEAANLQALYEGISVSMNQTGFPDANWHLMLIDDGSTDNTEEVVNMLLSNGAKIEYIKLTRNFGKESALTAGLDHCQNSSVILIDADLQHSVETIPEMIRLWQDGADMVVGIPTNRTPDILQKAVSHLYHKLISWSSKSPIVLHGGDFRLIDAKSVDNLKMLREKTRYMKGLYGYVGGNIKTISFREKKRAFGKEKFNIRKRLSLAVNGIVSTTTLPLRFFTILGLMIITFSTLYLIYLVFEILFFGKTVPGYASLIFFVIIMNGLIMLQVGAQSEYIAKLLQEVKKRPIYFVEKHINSHKRN